MIVLPEDEGPNSFVRSTVIVRVFPLTENSTFFMDTSESSCAVIQFRDA